jgi:hypothetical protein
MTKNKITVYVNGKINNDNYIAFLSEFYDVTVVKSSNYTGKEKIDLVLFIGGEDVTPQYYNENTGSKTKYNIERDKYEKEYLFNRFKNTPKLGICRGAQALTVWSGGKLIQHVEGHAVGGLHEIEMSTPYTDSIYKITSTHHQMMYPFGMNEENFIILGYSKYFLSNKYLNGNDVNIDLPKNFVEPEVVFYSKTNSLCIQGHPESPNCPQQTKQMMHVLINYYLKV